MTNNFECVVNVCIQVIFNLIVDGNRPKKFDGASIKQYQRNKEMTVRLLFVAEIEIQGTFIQRRSGGIWIESTDSS